MKLATAILYQASINRTELLYRIAVSILMDHILVKLRVTERREKYAVTGPTMALKACAREMITMLQLLCPFPIVVNRSKLAVACTPAAVTTVRITQTHAPQSGKKRERSLGHRRKPAQLTRGCLQFAFRSACRIASW
jgi:hypothetical protein